MRVIFISLYFADRLHLCVFYDSWKKDHYLLSICYVDTKNIIVLCCYKDHFYVDTTFFMQTQSALCDQYFVCRNKEHCLVNVCYVDTKSITWSVFIM